MSKSDSRAPRRAALAMIEALTTEGHALSESSGLLSGLVPADRARAQRLATETVRGAERAETALEPFLKNQPRDPIAWILRLGTWEILVDGAKAHGVVNDLVSIAGERKHTARGKGLINAVLRRVSESDTKWEDLPAQRMPPWLRRPVVAAYGRGRVAAMETAQGVPAPLDITPKDPASTASLCAALPATQGPSGTLRLSQKVQVTALPGYAEGEWWVQDAAASVPARLLDPKPGEDILDLCAAPGGKTMQLAASGANVTALDISEARMHTVTENLSRVGLSATTVVADALTWETEQRFDAILLDAPCSATGTLRRHPELPFVRDASALDALLPLQSALIDRALALLKPEGRLIYCTCSLLREEGEHQVTDALKRHPGLIREEGDPAWLIDSAKTPYGLRLTPEQVAEVGGWDGFYIARLFKGPPSS
ncbi:MAG: transcription antitermination factor NusB [Pseudomonadota bacterium]